MKTSLRKNFLKYTVFFLVLTIFAKARTESGLAPFAAGMFAALVYSRQNLFILSPMYVAASLIAGPDWNGLVFSVIPVTVMTAAYFVHFRIKRPVTMRAINLYVLAGQIPYLAIRGAEDYLLSATVNVILTQLFAYCAIIAVYAILIRGIKYRFTSDEVISSAVTLVVAAIGASNVQVFGISLLSIIAPFTVMVCCYALRTGTTVIIATLLGAGAAFSTGNVAVMAVFVCQAMAASAFKRTSMWFSAVALVAAEVMMGYYFWVYGGYGWLQPAVASAGVLAFLLIPKKYKVALFGETGDFSAGYASKTIVNRNKTEVSNRLAEVADVFADMSLLLKEDAEAQPAAADDKDRIAKEVATGFCGKCPNAEACFSALGTDTSAVLDTMAEAALAKGKAGIIDVPPFITSRCGRVNALITATNDAVRGYRNYKAVNDSVSGSKAMLADQMMGTARILANLAADVKKAVSFDKTRERRIIDELAYHNVVCSEAVVYGDRDFCVTLVVREEDASKKVIDKIVSSVLKCNLVRKGVADYVQGRAAVHLTVAPRYDILFGEAAKCREGNSFNGDSRSMQRIDEKSIVFALCDGMGSGTEAEKNSNAAISMIENFYKAGFDNSLILDLVNKLLALKNEENFSSVDMCVVDLRTGGADLIKMGAANGYIKRKNGVERVASAALPIGILEEARPVVERKVLLPGDIVVLVSDGITDVLGDEGMEEILEYTATSNPQTLADTILGRAVEAGAVDDVSVLCARVYTKD